MGSPKPTSNGPQWLQFTMQQAARNTETHHRWWSNNNLRHKAVQFVSAGDLQPSEFQDIHREDREGCGPKEVNPEQEETQTQDTNPLERTHQDAMFFFDSAGSQATNTGLPDPAMRSRLSDSDDTSEDEVVFTGRQSTRPAVIETKPDELREILQKTTIGTPAMTLSTPPDRAPDPNRTRGTNPPTEKSHASPSDVENETLADYIANMDSDYYDEDTCSNTHLEPEGGIDVHRATAQLDLSTPGSPDSQTRTLNFTPKHHPDHVDVESEARVQHSIDVLAKMYLDTDEEQAIVLGEDEQDEDCSFEGTDSGSDDGGDFGDIDLLDDMTETHTRITTKRARATRNTFASATAFADALESDPYYGFDVMDFDRPSLLKKAKGKQPAFDLILADSEFETQLQEAWQNDRKKKKAKKKEREELRSQGILANKTGGQDLKVKYSNGMNMEQLISETRHFLLSPKISLALPPMTKQRRKLIHELANTLNLKSQSRGDGLARFPILHKTARTPGYTKKTISKVDHLLSGRKLNRRLFKNWGSDAPRSKTKRGNAGAAVSYMDGEVVGASAPEIGAENRGRAILEKMGWSTGTALGATNNKGILLPVAHVVKNSRAGLG
ncbi:hypothetical protein NUU61_000344 [Penicillium alfredii]|uniref:Protein SQS1 n=1 Tax=Penicillium alfredii TaxID=1506179 RepID=A0A9W9KQK4_9EURO|nr:uncharacterized protein NUU61_000344 [Penicillium alfredii]KAJ5114585.1 hypothetical protein NUU61_000344 [Penicillium alfredii]